MIIAKKNVFKLFFCYFVTFTVIMIALICIYPIVLPLIMFIGFLSHKNIGIYIKSRVLAALYPKILQKYSNAHKRGRHIWKWRQWLMNPHPIFFNDVFEIESLYIYFLKTKTATLIVTFGFRIIFAIMIFTKSFIFKHFFAILWPLRC